MIFVMMTERNKIQGHIPFGEPGNFFVLSSDCFSEGAYVEIFKAAVLPDEIQESVDGLNRLDVAVVGQRAVPAALAWLYNDHNDDADEHGNQGGHHVVDHGAHAHLPGGSAVQGGDACRRGKGGGK